VANSDRAEKGVHSPVRASKRPPEVTTESRTSKRPAGNFEVTSSDLLEKRVRAAAGASKRTSGAQVTGESRTSRRPAGNLDVANSDRAEKGVHSPVRASKRPPEVTTESRTSKRPAGNFEVTSSDRVEKTRVQGPARASRRAPSGEPDVKRHKVTPPPACTNDDVNLFETLRQEFRALTNDKLKAILKANDQSQTGNKDVLVAKVADGAAFGKLPRCPSCSGGKIKIRIPGADGGLVSLENAQKKPNKSWKRYYCTGYYDDDEPVHCRWSSDTVVREEWIRDA